jgi:hypothetical protein
MKLEQVHKLQYDNDSLGENTFYFKLRQQMDSATYFKLLNCLVRTIPVINYRRPILAYLSLALDPWITDSVLYKSLLNTGES